MQSCERQMARLGDAQGRLNCLQIAHFSDEHYVRIFAQCRTQRIGEGMRIRVYLALVHQAFLMVVQKFNGIFNRDHVLFALAVDLVKHGSQGGRFT